MNGYDIEYYADEYALSIIKNLGADEVSTTCVICEDLQKTLGIDVTNDEEYLIIPSLYKKIKYICKKWMESNE